MNMIDWAKRTFVMLEARKNEDGTVVLHGHDNPDCDEIVGRIAANTSLVDYLAERNRTQGEFADPTPCPVCIDLIEEQLRLLDEIATPTPVESPVESPEVALRSLMAVPPPAKTPANASDDAIKAIAFLGQVDAGTLAKFEFLQAMRQKLIDDPAWMPTDNQTAAILKFNRPKPVTGPAVDLRPIPAGKYAVGTALFRIDKPSDGKWAGWIFAKMLVPTAEGGQDWDRIATQNPTEDACKTKKGDFLAKIVSDPASTSNAAATLETLLKGATA